MTTAQAQGHRFPCRHIYRPKNGKCNTTICSAECTKERGRLGIGRCVDPSNDQGIEILTEAIAACTETIDQHKGKLVVKEAPRALRMDNEEISGNEEEEEDTGMGEVDIEGAGLVE
ncbi:hypothetical protein YC2023_047519 [Brassica napus]